MNLAVRSRISLLACALGLVLAGNAAAQAGQRPEVTACCAWLQLQAAATRTAIGDRQEP